MHVSKLSLPLHPQSGNKFLQNEENSCESKDEQRLRKRNLKKVAKKFLKNLEVTKKDITFATDFRLKFERSFSNGSLIYWLYN